MKKISLLLSLIFATIFSGCEAEKDYISDKSLNQNYQLKRISFSEFKSNQSAFQKLREARSKKNPNILNRGVYNEDYGVFIDTTNIVVVENDGKHSITFQIIDEAFSNKVENLVLNSKDDGYVAYITEYLLSQQELQALGNGGELLSKEPDAITMLENNARISISGNGAHCVDVITVITRYCEDINGKVIENKGEGCYGGFFEVEHQVLTISEGCLSNGGGSSGGIGGYNPPTSGGNPVSGGGGSTGGSTGNTNPDINDGNPNPIITTPVLNQSKTEIKLLNTFSDEQLDWWNNEADEEVKQDILAYINQYLTLEQNEAIEFANEIINAIVSYKDEYQNYDNTVINDFINSSINDSYEIEIEGNESSTPPNCESFNFQNTNSNWQESAVQNIHFQVTVLTPQGAYVNHVIDFPQAVLFGCPRSLLIGNTTITSGMAASLSAQALYKSMNETVKIYGNKLVSELIVTSFFMNRLKHNYPLFIPGGRVNFNSTSINITPTQYQTNLFGTGDCN